ncbi:MAG: hypothetical protein VYE22_34760 [Myxococcota bacterium]|nr:hypothetical protein [Myxococcota bacterium]
MDDPGDIEDAASRQRQRYATAFGWVAGGALGLLTNWGLSLAVGDSYPVTWTTFALFLVGAFGGMALADRLGPKGFQPLGIAAGVLLAVIVSLVLALALT